MAVTTLFVTCSKDEGGEREAIDTGVCFALLDKDSTDLLNPDNPNGYKFSEMGLYEDSELKRKRTNINWELIPGENRFFNPEKLKEIYVVFFNAPMDYKINRDGKTIWCATSYLKLNQTTIDTVYTEVLETKNAQMIIKALYNGTDITKNNVIVRE